ncbi:deoxyribose-phosphate aldolase [Cohaesibacter marisflavi]|uniref:Deoxyribose-phosphate aldolase n=1 Tax=Cohaesibacter marisflavi TaxID=655353 RepID=A0A1I5CYK1_9HYPH|nr:deoxyribose-phosphate aldolase [Cohaesibacter marisflavi]SFN91967.1 deoxyribose-phosphate aldolase [Cohaesibacter marisflavi]
MEQKQLAQKAISLLDLTNLNDDCDDAAIEALCQRAKTFYGNTAAVCVWPHFVKKAKECLGGTTIKVATVVNFPHGGEDLFATLDETAKALEDGADEIDLVIPYEAFKVGRRGFAETMVLKVREAVPAPAKLKTILETGELQDADIIRAAADMAIEAGADFIKTSTGKVKTNATPEAAEIMMEAIAESGKPVGFKPAGGVRTLEDAGTYLAIAAKYMGSDWATPDHFRFGASGVLDALLATMQGQTAKAGDGY